jgi:hypothetical protein
MSRYLARFGTCLITLLLGAVWVVGALDTLTRPLRDLGRPHVGEAIIAFAGALMLPPEAMLTFASLLAGLKLMVGAFLLVALLATLRDDAMLDVALFTAALASAVAAAPGLIYGGELLQGAVGELMLCLIASWLAIHARGYLAREELPRPSRNGYVYAELR